MWFCRLVLLTALLHGSLVTGEGRTDPFALSLCRLWEECVRTVKVAEDGHAERVEMVCHGVLDMLRESGFWNCESLLRPYEEKYEDNSEQLHDVSGQLPKSNLASLALSGRTNYFSDCSEIHTAMALFFDVTSGVESIKPVGLDNPISVYCDQSTERGGWTIIQNRIDGSIDFNRPYDAFKYGFGSPYGEYWLGLENMYFLTNQNSYQLYIELEDWSGVIRYAKYSGFSVGSSASNFQLTVSGYSGTAGDGFHTSSPTQYTGYLNGQGFSARDVDHDVFADSCAGEGRAYTGGWWYKQCADSALNGPYLRPTDFTSQSGFGIFWNPFGGANYNHLKRSKMMVRPVDFEPF